VASLVHSASAPARPPDGIHAPSVTNARRTPVAAGGVAVAVHDVPRQYRCWVDAQVPPPFWVQPLVP